VVGVEAGVSSEGSEVDACPWSEPPEGGSTNLAGEQRDFRGGFQRAGEVERVGLDGKRDVEAGVPGDWDDSESGGFGAGGDGERRGLGAMAWGVVVAGEVGGTVEFDGHGQQGSVPMALAKGWMVESVDGEEEARFEGVEVEEAVGVEGAEAV